MLAELSALTAYLSLGGGLVLDAAEAHLRADAGAVAAGQLRVQAWLVEELSAMRAATMMDLRVPLLLSSLFWAALFAAVWYTPAAARLQSKRKIGELGILGAQVETCDRAVAVLHAVVSSAFGLVSLSFIGDGVCDMSPPHVKVMRIGITVTLGFMLHDFSIQLVADVVYGLRPVQWDMLLHHSVIGACGAIVLTSATAEPLLAIVAINLCNEISTIFLHLTKFLNECGFKDTLSYKAVGGCLVVSFFLARVVLISGTLMLAYRSQLCAIPFGQYTAASIYALIATHWLLNLYWFYKLMRLVVGPKDSTTPSTTPRGAREAEAETAPLLDDPSQTSQGAAD